MRLRLGHVILSAFCAIGLLVVLSYLTRAAPSVAANSRAAAIADDVISNELVCSDAAITPNGRSIAYECVPNLSVFDNSTGESRTVYSVAPSELAPVEQWKQGSIDDLRLSADGRFLAFYSRGEGFLPDDHNQDADIYVLETETGTFRRASVTSAGREAPQGINGNGSEGLAISPDGRYVYFTVDTEGFVRGDDRFGDGLADVVRKDMKTGELEIVSTSSSASQMPGGGTGTLALSSDGKTLIFASRPPDQPTMTFRGTVVAYERLYAKNLVTGALTEVPAPPLDRAGFDSVSVSADGRFVAFAYTEYKRGARRPQIYLSDRQIGKVTLLTPGRSATFSNGSSDHPVISGDGRYVGFYSWASDLVGDDNNNRGDLFVWDVRAQRFERLVHPLRSEAEDADQTFTMDNDGDLVYVDGNGVFYRAAPAGRPLTARVTSKPTAQVPTARTYSQSSLNRSGVPTFLNYHNASGSGPRIAYKQVVQVSCKVYDKTIQSAFPDGYWYRIASSPWNDSYYAAANTFLNGDPPNGPYGRNTDFAVPNCDTSSVASSSGTKPTPTPSPASAAGTKKHRWIVTLGDSYTAGDGAGANYDSCNRSYNSYAWLYMNLLRGAGLSVDIWQSACSGAVTSDVTEQISRVLSSPAKEDADVVFLTIGGNDLSFRDIVIRCLLPTASGLAWRTWCDSKLNEALDKQPRVVETTKGLLQVIASKMPHAQVVLVGYPPLTTPTCPNAPYNNIIRSAQDTFNTQQSTMVTKLNRSQDTTRYHFVSTAQRFAGHGPCAAQKDQYINGVTYHETPRYHPNATGNQRIAQLFYSSGVQNWFS